MKRIISLILAAVLMFSTVSVLASCGTAEKDTAPEYVSEEMREEHIKKLIGDGQVIAETVKTVTYDEELEMEIVNEVWTVDPDYATAVGKTVSNISVVDETTGTTSNIKLGITKMSLIMENDYYALYMDLQGADVDLNAQGGGTTDFAVLDKTTGHVFHSNSNYEANSTYANVKAPSKDVKGTPDMKVMNPIVSALAIEAYDVSNKRYEFNFREHCLADLRLKVVKMSDNQIRIIYTLGNDPDKDLVPPVLTEETYAWIVERLTANTDMNDDGDGTRGEDALKDLKSNYKYVTPENLELEDRERLIKNYPLLDVIPMYICRVLNTRQKQIVKEAMQLAGFTADMLKKEMEAVEYSGPERAVMFTIPVDLTLTDDGLTVNVDSTLIQAPSKQKMYKISLYRALGSVTPTSKMTGDPYIITPDGSGAYMPADGYVTTSVYTDRVYGGDLTFQETKEDTKMMQIVSPYLILDRAELGGLMVLLEDGKAQAFATARPSNSTNNPGASVNFDLVYSERDYRTYTGGQGNTSSGPMDNSSAGVVLSKEQQVANFQVKYLFNEGGLTYADYAKIYRDYLIEEEILPAEPVEKGSKTPFYAEIIGAINKNESVAGMPVDATKALTSYTELKEIVEKLVDAGVGNINVRYMYWANDGFYNTINNTPDLMSEMGSKSELTDLVSYLESEGVGFFPSADFLYVYKDKATDALNYTNDAARRLDMRVARVYQRNLATGMTSQGGDYTQTILSPGLIPSLAESYKKGLDSIIGNKQISLGTIGQDLNSNYKVGNILNRTQALDAHIAALETFAADDYEILVTTGNDYTWKYADHIVNLPIGSSEFLSSTGAIPFIQMVLHGYLEYAAEPFNISADYETHLLKCLETGSGVHFRWMYDDNSVFDNTTFNDFYSLNYNDSFDRAVELYKEVASILDDVTSEPITLHESADAYLVYDGEITVLEEGDEGYVEGEETPSYQRIGTTGVYHVIYGDGDLDLYINYNSYDVELEDRSIVPALGYLEVK